MPRLGGAYCFVVSVRNGSRRVRSQRKSVDWGTMGPALGGAYECYAHISSYYSVSMVPLATLLIRVEFTYREMIFCDFRR